MRYALFLNDKIVEDTEGGLSTLDRGFLYGDGLFETFRTYHKKPFRLQDHVTRLSNSARHFDIPFRYTFQQIQQVIEQLLAINNLEDAYIRMTLSRGSAVNGLIPAQAGSSTFVIHTKPFVAYPSSFYKTGVPLITSRVRRSTTCPLSGHKTLNFLANYLMKKEAVDNGAHDAIILNTDNHITECAVSNIFIVEKNTVITPSLKANVLPGITREIVLDLCSKNDIHTLEGLFGIERALCADEVFITNSLMEVMPVSKINGQPVGNFVPGTVTGILQNKYKAADF